MTPFIDTHLHCWNPVEIRYDWLEQAPDQLKRVFEPDQIGVAATASGLQKAILVQAANSLEETQYLLRKADETDWIVGVVGWVDLQHPEKVEQQLNTVQKNAHLKGIRHLIHNERADTWLCQASVIDSLKLIASRTLSFDLVGTSLTHLDCAITVARAIPELWVILDHLNHPPNNVDQRAIWRLKLRQAAELPNMIGKISGLGTLLPNRHAWQVDDILPILHEAFTAFGPDRLMLGSDWPVCLLAGSYGYTIQRYIAGIQVIGSPIDVCKILCENAERVYQL